MRKIISVLCGMALSVAFILPAAEALAANSAPTVDTVTPTSGKSDINQTVTFTTTASDADGWQDLQNLYFIVHATGNGAKACYVKYYRRDNKIYLRNDANSAWLGGYAPGSAKTIENSYAKVDCASTTVSGSGNTLTVTWSISFKSTYVGVKNTYLQATDMSNASSGWIQKGSWMIGDVNAAQFVSQSIPATLYYNQDFTATITMKNTGTTTWTKANSYKLGTQNPAGNKTWGLNRVELSEEDAIEPGQSKTFTFTAKAPATAGTYNLQFKMVRELVAWFGNLSTNVAIKVTKEPYAAQFISQSVPAAYLCRFRGKLESP